MKKYFRKGLAGIVAAGTLCAAMPAFQMTAAQTLAGDVNLDGTVNSSDVVDMQMYLLNRASFSHQAFLNGDLTGDGRVNIFDLMLLKRTAAPDPVSNTVYIHLKGNSITTEGDDNNVVQITGSTAKITASGIYYVDGELTDGQIYVETPAEDIADVEIVLDGVTMTNADRSCIYTSAASGSEKTKLTLRGENTLTDTAAAAYTESGVIYTNNKLTVTRSSSGSLHINSSMNAGINSEKKISLNGGTLVVNTSDSTNAAVTAPDADGIKSDKNIEIEGGVIEMDTSGDGIKSDAAVYILGGDISIKAGNDAVQAGTELSVSGGSVVASGDRGFRLGLNGLLNITGGTVLATATDYQVNGNETIDMSGSTQTIMLLDMAAEWKKASAITVGDKTYTSNKKYDYVLVSDPDLAAAGTYSVLIGGSKAKHSTDAAGSFKNTGTVTQYTAVEPISGVMTVSNPAIVYGSSGVTLYDGAGTQVSALDGVTVSGKTATVTAGGVYTVKGSASDGQLVVDTTDLTVQLDLEGLELSNSTKAPIYVENVGDEVTISVKSGTVNTISDGTAHSDTYVNSDGETVTVNGAVFSRDDLKIKGKGSLTVNGNFEDGIVCKDDLKLWNGNITVNAVDDGIRGNGSVRIGDPQDTDYSSLHVDIHVNNGTTGGDGIKSTDTETGKGYITINGGTVTIDAYCDGIQAEQTFTMNGGDVTITTNAGSSYTGTSSGGNNTPWGGGMGGGMGDGNANKTDISAKGIKAVGLYDTAGTAWQSGGDLYINGGTLHIDSADDCLHCGGDMNLTGGVMTLATADDGAHSDHTLTIGAGTADSFDDVVIYVTKAYEGLEGQNIVQNSGSVVVNSTDDGYNAAGGADGSGNTSFNPWGQGGGWGSGSGNNSIELKGGFGLVNVTDGDHDGFDSNGSLTISGGYFITNGNEPFDSDGAKSYTGGVYVINTGSGGMGGMGGMGGSELPTTVTASASASSGTRISLVDGSNVIVSFTAGKNVTTLKAGCSDTPSAKFYTGGTVSGGTAIAQDMGTQSAYVGGTLSGGTAVN